MRVRNRVVAFAVVVGVGGIGCGPPSRDRPGETDGAPEIDAPVQPPGPDATVCGMPPASGPDVALAAPYDMHYTVYDLGPVPGVPNPLGGTAILASNPNVLLVAGGSESSGGAIYSIALQRDACNHIVGFLGQANMVASTPFVDANLAYVSQDLLLYTEWPQYHLSQLATASTAPDRRTDLRTIGMTDAGDSGPGGLGRVPPGLAGEGGLRLVTWPAGRWFEVTSAADGNLLSITGVTERVTLPNNPGGFAYVPAGSPGFTMQAVIVAEWRSGDPTQDRVAVYDVDANGDPIVATRREFMKKFPRPWGAYFEPVTGDYMFLSWGTGMDRVYIVQGFVPPPPVG